MKKDTVKIRSSEDYYGFYRFKITHSIIIFSLVLPKKNTTNFGRGTLKMDVIIN